MIAQDKFEGSAPRYLSHLYDGKSLFWQQRLTMPPGSGTVGTVSQESESLSSCGTGELGALQRPAPTQWQHRAYGMLRVADLAVRIRRGVVITMQPIITPVL